MPVCRGIAEKPALSKRLVSRDYSGFVGYRFNQFLATHCLIDLLADSNMIPEFCG
jgi:hypothetical protein